MISIITITFHNFDDLVLTLNSLRGVKNEDIELIVINGNPLDDNAKSYLAKYAIEVSFLVIPIFENDLGISDAFNKGLKLAKGEGILFLNSGDILIDLEYLNYALNKLNSNKCIGIVHGDVIFQELYTGKILMKPLIIRESKKKRDTKADLINLVNLVNTIPKGMVMWHQTMVVRRTLFERFGHFSLMFKSAMDYEWLCRLVNPLYQNDLIQSNGCNNILIDYYEENPIVLFSGSGISVSREWYSIKECFIALKINKLLTLKNFFFYCQRVIFFILRKTLIHLKLFTIYKFIKRKRFLQDKFIN